MVVSIIANQAATLAQRNIARTNGDVENSLNRLSSGQRVNRASEDAASMAVVAGLAVDVSAYRAAQINITSGTSMLQIADGSLGKISDILIRMKQLGNQAISGHMSATERAFADTEYQQLLEEIDRITASTEFNGVNLFGGVTQADLNTVGTSIDANDGFVGFQFGPATTPGDVFQIEYASITNVMTVTNLTQSISQTLYVTSPATGYTTEYTFDNLGFELTINSDFDDTVDIVHVGANEEFDTVASATAAAVSAELQIGTGTAASDRITVDLPLTNTTSLGLVGSDLTTALTAASAVTAIDAAIDTLNISRSSIGANMSRLEFSGGNISTILENTRITMSSLLDADVSEEITELSSKQALIQTAINMLARANERPDVLLGLLR